MMNTSPKDDALFSHAIKSFFTRAAKSKLSCVGGTKNIRFTRKRISTAEGINKGRALQAMSKHGL